MGQSHARGQQNQTTEALERRLRSTEHHRDRLIRVFRQAFEPRPLIQELDPQFLNPGGLGG